MNGLKQSEDLKLKLIQLVTVKGMSIASAARELGVGVRLAQEFFSKEKNWMRVWWDNYEKELAQYGEYLGKRTSESLGSTIPAQYSHPLATEEDKEVYETYKRIMGKVGENTKSGILFLGMTKEVREKLITSLKSGELKFENDKGQHLVIDQILWDRVTFKVEDKVNKAEPDVKIGFNEPPKMKFSVDKEVYKKDKGDEDNSRILVISDLHFPYHHKDVFKFLQYLKDKYNPTRIICTGDEMDGHALSFHDSDPDLPSAGDELRKALPFVQELYRMFPKMDILDSNHGSLVYRKAKHHGVPRHYIKGYNEILGVGEGWKWSFDLTIDLPNGTKCYFHHGKSPDVVKLSQVMGMSAVQGHYHSVFKVDYWANPAGLYFGMQTACLVDRDAYAFAYENSNLKKPIIGTGLIINSHPILEPLLMDEKGNWVGF